MAKTASKQRFNGWMCALVANVLLLQVSVIAAAGLTIHPSHIEDADLAEVERLLGEGADVNAKHISGASAMHHVVVVSAEMGTSGQRIRNGKIYFAGQWGATGHLAIAERLLEAGAEVNGMDASGQTPLHIAALTGHSEASRFLLGNGADVNARDHKGRTPLVIAKWSATDEAIAEFAAATGQDVNASGMRRRAYAVIKLLTAYGGE
jgi:ankyrin repeat protein